MAILEIIILIEVEIFNKNTLFQKIKIRQLFLNNIC